MGMDTPPGERGPRHGHHGNMTTEYQSTADTGDMYIEMQYTHYYVSEGNSQVNKSKGKSRRVCRCDKAFKSSLLDG